MAERVNDPAADATVDPMDGLISFYASHHALRADKVLRAAGYTVALVPGPREVSPNCGVALRFVYAQAAAVEALLIEQQIQFEALHAYRPRVIRRHRQTESLPTSSRRLTFTKLWNRG
jgi:hypothetical protein